MWYRAFSERWQKALSIKAKVYKECLLQEEETGRAAKHAGAYTVWLSYAN